MLDTITYSLEEKNYYKNKTKKQQIIIGDTKTNGIKHITSWLNRYNGENKKTAHFTILKNGVIYQHINSDYYTNYLSSDINNKKSIIILLENYGWLNKIDNIYTDWKGLDIYSKDIYHKVWKNYEYWDKYTVEQLNSLIYITNMLCEKHNINRKVFNHNTKIYDLKDYNGILYKSNINKNYLDTNPSWFYDEFKIKIEK